MSEWRQIVSFATVQAHRAGWLGVWDTLKAAITRRPRQTVPTEMVSSVWVKATGGLDVKIETYGGQGRSEAFVLALDERRWPVTALDRLEAMIAGDVFPWDQNEGDPREIWYFGDGEFQIGATSVADWARQICIMHNLAPHILAAWRASNTMAYALMAMHASCDAEGRPGPETHALAVRMYEAFAVFAEKQNTLNTKAEEVVR